jgi:hypothetical protein
MKIKVFSIGEEFNGMHGLGTPEDLEKFINKKASEIAEVYFANT